MGITRQQKTTIAVLVFGSFVAVLNQTLVAPALPTIMKEMQVNASTVQWLTTVFTMVSAVMIPISAYLTDRFSIRRLFITCMSIFCLGTILCAVAPSFGVLLLGRVVQALGGGVLMPMVLTVLLLTFPAERRGVAMGWFSVVIVLAPTIGPVVSGLIIDNASWHIMFYGIAVLLLLVIGVACVFLKKEKKVVPEGLSLDKPSVFLSTVGFGSMLYGFSVVGSTGLSPVAVVSIVVGIGVTVLFFIRQTRLSVPMLQVGVLRTREFLIGTVVCMIVQCGVIANGVLVPIYVQSICGYSATISGLVILPGVIIMGIMGPISGKLFDLHGPRLMSIAGMAILTLGTIGLCFLTSEGNIIYLAVLIAVRSFGMSLSQGPINTWSINALPNKLINHGNAVVITLRQVAGSLGTAVIISGYSLSSDFHMQFMGLNEANTAGMNFAFMIQVVVFATSLILCIALVGVKKKTKSGAKDSDKTFHKEESTS